MQMEEKRERDQKQTHLNKVPLTLHHTVNTSKTLRSRRGKFAKIKTQGRVLETSDDEKILAETFCGVLNMSVQLRQEHLNAAPLAFYSRGS
jgi:hypothetical protein